MQQSSKPTDDRMPAGAPFDVVICGGGLAGLLLARQLRREMPEAVVTIVEKQARPLPDGCHKVGESSVELAAHYMNRLGLAEYMGKRQLPKWGLRFYPGGGDLPLHKRTELGPCAEPPLKTYQLDRGRLEDDLRGMNEQDGVRLIEGAKVTAIELQKDGVPHTIRYEKNGETHELRARWVVDATGYQALIRKGQKLTRGSKHVASSGWFRIKGDFDINEMVPKSETEWHERPCSGYRRLSTNHFMGDGYWAWVIPLSTGLTSIGLVIHHDTHDAINIAGLDRTLAFLRKHEPHLLAAVEKYEIKDFLCLHNYSNEVSRAWSEDRWAIVGVAGPFADPLFSPGSDFIAFSNCFTLEMMRTDMRGGDLKEKAMLLNVQYRSIQSASIRLFSHASPIYGHASAMAYKVFWNNFAYWSFTCQYYQQELCRLDAEWQDKIAVYGRRFLELIDRVEGMLSAWAKMAPERPEPLFKNAPAFPSVLIDAHIATGQKMTVDETLAYLKMRTQQGNEIVGELVLRIVQELGPQRGQELLEQVQFAEWGITVPQARLDIEAKEGLSRRHSLPDLARDVERGLGPVRRHPRADEARELLVGAMS